MKSQNPKLKSQKLFLLIFLTGLLFFPLILEAAGLYQVEIFDDKNKNGKIEAGEFDDKNKNGVPDPGETIETKIAYYAGLIPCGEPICLSDSTGKFEEFEEKRKECLKKGKSPSEAFQDACTNIGAGDACPDIGGEFRPKEKASCKFCHFPVMLLGVINFLILPPTGIVFIIAVLLLMVGGAMFIFSAGRPAMTGQARRIMTATVIGLVIIYASWIIVNTFLTFIGVSQNFEALQPNKWNEVMFNCPIYVPKP